MRKLLLLLSLMIFTSQSIWAQQSYRVKVKVVGNGEAFLGTGGSAVTANQEQSMYVQEGGTAQLSFRPASGYKLSSVTDNNNDVTSRLGTDMAIVAEKDWTNCTENDLYWYQFAEGQEGTVEATPEGIAITNHEIYPDIWQPQTEVLDGATLEAEHNYIVRITAKIPNDGTIQVNMGSWEGNEQYMIDVTGSNSYQQIDVEFPNFSFDCYDDAHVLFQNGWVIGTCIVKNVQIIDMSVNTSKTNTTSGIVSEIDWTQQDGYYGDVWYSSDYATASVERGVGLVIESFPPDDATYWEPQVPMIAHLPDITEGGHYQLRFTLDAPATGEIRLDFCSWDGTGATSDAVFEVQKGLRNYVIDFVDYPTECTDAMIFYQCGKIPGTHIIKDVQLFDLASYSSGSNELSYTIRNIYENHNIIATFVNNSNPVSQCATPVINRTGNLVTISCDTPNARIFYTIDGSKPTTNSILYTNPITPNKNCTIKAFAIADGYNSSDVATFTVDWISNQHQSSYRIKVRVMGNGEVDTGSGRAVVTSNKDQAFSVEGGETVQLTFKPASGYELGTVMDGNKDVTSQIGDTSYGSIVAEIDWTQQDTYYGDIWYSDEYASVSVEKGTGLIIDSNPPGDATYWEPQVPMIAHIPEIEEGGQYQVRFDVTSPAAGEIRLDFCSWDGSGATKDAFIQVEEGYNKFNIDFLDYPTYCTDAMIFYQCGHIPGIHIIRKVQVVDIEQTTGSGYGDLIYTISNINEDHNITVIFDESETGINDIIKNNDDIVKAYSLNGILLKRGKRNEVMNTLPHGVYIINGRKIVK